MAKEKKVPIDFPYPPSPEVLPEGIMDFSPEYARKQKTLVICLITFLLSYFSLIAGSAFMILVCIFLISFIHVFAFLGIFFFGVSFVYLVKGLFRSEGLERDLHIPITEKDHPKLFGFIRKLCAEMDVDEPNEVFVSPDVNAAAMERISLVNLFVKPKKDLLLGCGLVNFLNLSEFKGVLAHEFGHFSQTNWASAYSATVFRICVNIVSGKDWFEKIVDYMMKQQNLLTVIAFPVWAGTGIFRWVINKIFGVLAFQSWNVLREAEFHADLVSASLAGSNAITHGLYRTQFAALAFMQCRSDLLKAADHKIYTSDLYYHQHAAGDIIRKREKNPYMGIPPKYKDPHMGRKVQIFDPDKEEDPADQGDYHPSNYDREENVKKRFIAAEDDPRSAWILFNNPVELREELTWKMYRWELRIPKSAKMTDPKEVQKFIDNEHQETTYDDKYEGAYDDRLLNPGDLDELDLLIRTEPWEDARLLKVHEILYKGLRDRVEDRREISKELDKVRNQAGGAGNRRLRKIIKNLEDDLEEANDWFRTLDRRVYLVYMQMSYRVNNDLYYELSNRYRFHMAVQGIYKTADYNYGRALFYANAVFSMAEDNAVSPDLFAEVMHVLRESRSAIRKLLREAKEIKMPAMKNFEEGERLADFLLDQEVIREPNESSIDGRWISKLLSQLEQVSKKAARLHFKSMGGLLSLQEKIVAEFVRIKGPANAAPAPTATEQN